MCVRAAWREFEMIRNGKKLKSSRRLKMRPLPHEMLILRSNITKQIGKHCVGLGFSSTNRAHGGLLLASWRGPSAIGYSFCHLERFVDSERYAERLVPAKDSWARADRTHHTHETLVGTRLFEFQGDAEMTLNWPQ